MKRDENDNNDLFPSPEDMFAELQESIDAGLEPISSMFEDIDLPENDPDDPESSAEHTIEIVKSVEQSIISGHFDKARELIEEGKESTSCSWCQEKLDRLEVDVGYVDGVCQIAPADCNSGKIVVANKANHMYTTLENALHMKEEQEQGEENANR